MTKRPRSTPKKTNDRLMHVIQKDVMPLLLELQEWQELQKHPQLSHRTRKVISVLETTTHKPQRQHLGTTQPFPKRIHNSDIDFFENAPPANDNIDFFENTENEPPANDNIDFFENTENEPPATQGPETASGHECLQGTGSTNPATPSTDVDFFDLLNPSDH